MLKPAIILQNRYLLQQKLAQNAGRQTWLAEDESTKSPVIVKLLAFNPLMQWQDLKLFEREASVLKNLNHSRIPQYRDYFSIEEQAGDGLPWFALVQEYIPGNSLQQLLDEGKTFTAQEVKRIATDILNILIYLHELSPPVFHRDIKPSNLILGKNGAVYLIDFGAVENRAKAEGASFTVVGTNGYAAPEQWCGKAVASSDLYALGATLIHLLTKITPPDLPRYNLRMQFAELVNLNPEEISWLEQLTEPALERRFTTARQALDTQASVVVQKEVNPSVNSSLFLYGRALILAFGSVAFVSLFPIAFYCFSQDQPHSKQVSGSYYVGELNIRQQAYFSDHKGNFGTDISSLGISVKTQTLEYAYHTTVMGSGTNQTAYSYTSINQPSQNSGLRNYAGLVSLTQAGTGSDVTTIAILCGTVEPGAPAIKPINGTTCSSGSYKSGGYSRVPYKLGG